MSSIVQAIPNANANSEETASRPAVVALGDNAFEAHNAGMAERGLALVSFHVIG
jgi:hypothetical protein